MKENTAFVMLGIVSIAVHWPTWTWVTCFVVAALLTAASPSNRR